VIVTQGGFGFGGGGAGSLNGGGGGGFSGGGGGGPDAAGGGGGSYISEWGTLLESDVDNQGNGSVSVAGEVIDQALLNRKFYVNKNVTGGNNNGSSWANAFINLQDALARQKQYVVLKYGWLKVLIT
jgi:hypothetical protein